MIKDQLISHALDAAQGERGVLVMKVPTQHLIEMRATKDLPPGTKSRFKMDPTTFVPYESFLESIRDHHVDPTAADRYRPTLETLDPTRDVALFLSSDDDGQGAVFTRWIVFKAR